MFNIYLNFTGNTEEAFNLYKSVFGGEFSSIIRAKDMPSAAVELSTSDENKILNINYPVSKEDVLMGSDAMEGRGRRIVKGNNVRIAVSPESKEEADRIYKALSAGGTVEIPMSDMPWNAYFGSFTDRYGIPWTINYGYKENEMKSRPVGARAAAQG